MGDFLHSKQTIVFPPNSFVIHPGKLHKTVKTSLRSPTIKKILPILCIDHIPLNCLYLLIP